MSVRVEPSRRGTRVIITLGGVDHVLTIDEADDLWCELGQSVRDALTAVVPGSTPPEDPGTVH